MGKLSGLEDKKQVNRKRKISLSLLGSYLMILLVPAAAVIIIYFTAQNAMMQTQEERLQNSLAEVGAAFEREVDEAQNVGYYVSREKRLRDYLYKGRPEQKEAEFFAQYTIASNYPNYSLTNQVIKSVFILTADSRYIMKIPQVIPQTNRGVATLEGFPFGSYEEFITFYEDQDKEQILFFYENAERGTKSLFLPCQMSSVDMDMGQCAIVVQLDWNQIKSMLRPLLLGKEGMAALLDENGQVLAGYENSEIRGGTFTIDSGQTMEDWLSGCIWGKNSMETFTVPLEYNGWSLTVSVPRQVLTENIGPVRYAAIVLCVAAIVLGILVCLAYWYERKNMVQEYFQIHDRMGAKQEDQGKETVQFWRSFGGFLENVDKLQNTVEQQERLLKDDFFKRWLYGDFDSEQALLESAEKVGISLTEDVYCVVDMEFEDPSRGDFSLGREAFLAMLEDCLARHLPWTYWKYPVSELSHVVLVKAKGLDSKEIRQAFEQINYEFYSRFEFQSYIGIGEIVDEPLEISRQYEIAFRLREYARYQGIRVPVLAEDVTEEQAWNQPLFFSMDMEMKLINQIQSGNQEQLEELLSQIEEVYFRPGASRHTYGHTIEMLRSCIYRCIPEDAEEAKRLRRETENARCKEEIFRLTRETTRLCQRMCAEKTETLPEAYREKIAVYVEEHYGNPCLNLNMLAEWLEEPERKLYNDFKLGFGMSFSCYLEQKRIDHACVLLKEGVSVKDTAQQVGYCSDYSFRRAFKRVVGIPPSDFRKI